MKTVFEVTVNGRRFTCNSYKPYTHVVLGLRDYDEGKTRIETLRDHRKKYYIENNEQNMTLDEFLEQQIKGDVEYLEEEIKKGRYVWRPIRWFMSLEAAEARRRGLEYDQFIERVVVEVGVVVTLEGGVG